MDKLVSLGRRNGDLYKKASVQIFFFKERAKERNWEGDRCLAKRVNEFPSIIVRKL